MEPSEQNIYNTTPIYLLKSVYEGRPYTIFFQYPKAMHKSRNLERAERLSKAGRKCLDLNYKYKFIERINPTKCIDKAFKAAGF